MSDLKSFRNLLLTVGLVTAMGSIFLLLATPAGAGEVKYKVSPVLTAADETRYQFDVRVQTYLKGIVENWQLGIEDRNPAILTMFEMKNKPDNGGLLPWSGEFAGKHLTGAVEILRLTGDERLRAHIEGFVKRLISLQEDNGYLGPWPKEHQLTGTRPSERGPRYSWDAWNHYHIMIGLIKWYELTGDKAALNVTRKIGTLLYETYHDKPDVLLDLKLIGWGRGSEEFNLTQAHSLMRLYEIVGDERYMALSRQIIHDTLPRYGNYLKLGLEGKPFYQAPGRDARRWERLHILLAMTRLYWVTGNEDYRTSFENLWWSIVQHDSHNTLAFTTEETATGNPYKRGRMETCCAVAYNAMSVDMLKLTGESVVADVIEATHFNALRGAQDISGKWSTYHTGCEGVRAPSTVDIAFQIRPGSEELNCCSVNIPRGFGLISEWALMRDEQGLVLNWYGKSKFDTKFKGSDIRIEQETSYPANGKIRITVTPSKATQLDLRLRIPFWSKNTAVRVNSTGIPTPPAGQYLSINRQWKPGDVVELTLDMAVSYWPGERARKGHASFYYGPLLLAFRPEVLGKPELNGRAWPDGPIYVGGEPDATVTFSVGNSFRLDCLKYSEAGRMSISIDGKLRETIDFYDPDGTAEERILHAVAYDNLGPGTHEVVLKVLEKSEKSKGNRVRFGLRNYDEPVFDMKKFSWKPVENKDTNTLVTIQCTDQAGKTVNLVDFDSAGWNDQLYATWLSVENEGRATFSKQNPLRLIRTVGLTR